MTTVLPNARVTPTLSIEEAGRLMGLSRTSAYEAVREGAIPTVRLGRAQMRVATAAVLEMLGFEPDGQTRDRTRDID